MFLDCEKFLISGVVQGVGFRYHTCHEGLRLGLTGYAKNLSSGDVEVIASGTQDQLEAFAQWLAHGPRTATVERVVREKVTPKSFRGFEIL